MPEVAITLRSPWGDLLPRQASEAERRQRWATWLRLARASGLRNAARDWAGPQDRCTDCAYARGGWCREQALPCAVSPVLTLRHSVPGMACMGAGFTPRQLSLAL